MTLDDLDFLPQGTPGLNIQAFDCGRKSVNDFFHNEAQEYQDELFGKTYYWVMPDNPSEVVAGFTVANASIFQPIHDETAQNGVIFYYKNPYHASPPSIISFA